MKFKLVSLVAIGLSLSSPVMADGTRNLVERQPTIRFTSPIYGELQNPKDFELTWEVLEETDEFLGFRIENVTTGESRYLTDAHRVKNRILSKPTRIEPGNYRVIAYHYGRKKPYSLAGVSDTFKVNYTYEPFWTVEKDATKLCPIFTGLDGFYIEERQKISCTEQDCVEPQFYSYISDSWILHTRGTHRLPENKEIVQVQCMPE